MTIHLDDDLRLELTAAKHAAALFAAIENNRAHLATFLPWVPFMRSVEEVTAYVNACELRYQQKEEVSFVILLEDVLVGRIGIHHLDLQNRSASIGYWLVNNAEGKGIITRSCKKLITYGFEELGLHRIEIKAAAANLKSQAIPEKLDFTKEGVLRHAEWVNGEFLDLLLYSVLDSEWLETTNL
ncbi:GNAT family N-acetyltransferase [Rufibacter sediminis]|uniref:GNAT family N-acetyltransferase n=1 Tax=Rufibacter sediminis TaxID=2762756 RepID=A0ABR6VW51_9BACT|nr:GNAT family protein [Rufibacter sediminis]MBC3541058.1 GNAT family N-acetyltransferase [Rufibacter sediminis]